MTRARRPLRRTALVMSLLLILATIAPLPLHGVTAQEGGETVAPVTLQVTPGEVTDEGQRWIDGVGLHIRDLVVTATVEGDVSGTASVTVDLDWSGPCDPDELSCDGSLELLGKVILTTSDASWDGLLAVEGQGFEGVNVHSILIGRGAEAGRAIVLDTIETGDMAAMLVLGGTSVDLGNRRGGGTIHQSACITGDTRADGGFLSSGIIADAGPVNITMIGVGESSHLGRYGQARHQGDGGTFQTSYIEQSNGPHAFGSFAMAGASGAYSEVAGFGYTRSTVSEDSRCDSGRQITTVWTGEFHFVTDPSAFLRPRVAFASLANGDRLMNPIIIEATVENFVLEPAGEVADGQGHLHLMIEAPCIEPGEPIPEDDAHVHFNAGETTAELNLIPGRYRLCLQLSDGEHNALPYTSVITITVLSSESTLSVGTSRFTSS